ncbi:MAG: hypothetical protein A3D31_18460 [Candidatus Fluviicola riflensis]|nr:MAG: hypothetical protein CHH17_03700 [Candidatus Fluviicola riflensis]OGS76432.1 MAG: hypothetical protein A3D31_18460 [Candidatus Fluviicola riflensis]OGS82726.1 MAG: hypothetical protein A2724_13285 [Fluviicola sp. RIFCSPHIGHO2_01_FULL_43_53]OGS89025.1 MAG: hypothetical protein A3E30_16945 [Fluviicola sp. RIFCSPHIGHO2_12_FULL_43_24]
MKALLTSIFLIFSFVSTAQDDYYKDISASQIVSVIDKVGFSPTKITKDVKAFKIVILQLGTNEIKQVNIDSWWLCNNRKDDNFTIYNMLYKEVTKETFDLYCKELISLMVCDGTATQTN